MITIQLTPDDLAKMRFAYSPMLEIVTSYLHLTKVNQHALHRRWAEEAGRSLYGMEFPYLGSLLGSKSYIPDFLTPTPLTSVTTFDGELKRIQRVPAELIRKNVTRLMTNGVDSEIVRQFLAFPYEALYCLLEEMRLYWTRALAHHWPRMIAVTEGDVLYRARQLALEGSAALFAGLSPAALVQQGPLQLALINKPETERGHFELNGQGLHLVPTLFNAGVLLQIEPEWQPMLVYGSRGTGLWWEAPSPAPDQSLEIALGEGRARVLRTLTTPAHTGEIAQRLDITAGAASQHLSRLNQAGLVEPHRSGRRVYYQLTRRGEQLLTLFS